MNETKVNISYDELCRTTSYHYALDTRDICDIIAFDADLQQYLAKINAYADNDKQDAADDMLDKFCVTLSFGSRKLELYLGSMDTFDAFCSMLQVAATQIDLNRTTTD